MTNELLSTIRSFLQYHGGQVSVQELFEGLVAQEGLDALLIKRQQDLITFLKMHSHLFKVTGGQVSLIPMTKIEVSHPLTLLPNKSAAAEATVKTEGSPIRQSQQVMFNLKFTSWQFHIPDVVFIKDEFYFTCTWKKNRETLFTFELQRAELISFWRDFLYGFFFQKKFKGG